MTAAQQVYSFVAQFPPNTPLPALTVIPCQFPEASVVWIRWRVPPGPSGTMGFAITSDGVNIIPVQSGTFIVADDESAQWDMQGYPDAGNWQVTGYNTDAYPHSVYVDFGVVPPGADVAPPAGSGAGSAPVPNALLSPSPPDVTTFIAGLQVPT